MMPFFSLELMLQINFVEVLYLGMPKNTNKYNLTDRQIKFCENYVVSLNATQSALSAGYSKKTSAKIAYKLLVNIGIQQYIQDLKEDASGTINITLEQSIRQDLKLIDTFNYYLDVLENIDSTEEETQKAKCVLKVLNATVYNSAMDRIAKKLGFFDRKPKEDNTTITNIINLGAGIEP